MLARVPIDAVIRSKPPYFFTGTVKLEVPGKRSVSSFIPAETGNSSGHEIEAT
jgi:hypothetical protein